jgi:hypothetical protein
MPSRTQRWVSTSKRTLKSLATAISTVFGSGASQGKLSRGAKGGSMGVFAASLDH